MGTRPETKCTQHQNVIVSEFHDGPFILEIS